MTPHQESTQQALVSQTAFHELLREKLREAVRFTLIQVLEAEVEAYVGAATYERVSSRQDHRNGHKGKLKYQDACLEMLAYIWVYESRSPKKTKIVI